MARIAGINIPPHKHAEIGLTAIYGIGRQRAREICEACGIPYAKKVKDLTDGDQEKIRDQIAKYIIEGDLRRETTMNIKRLMDLGCYDVQIARSVAEAMGGLRHLTAEPGRVPVRVGVSIGDTLAALHGVIGILLALQHRHASGRGQVIDVALYEAVFNCMESLLPEYSAFGAVRGPAGSALPGIAPSNAYRCSDGGYALIAGNGDTLPVSLFPADGTWPTGTAKYEKRNLALQIPVLESDLCTQCGKCVFVCPHSAIRAKVLAGLISRLMTSTRWRWWASSTATWPVTMLFRCPL